MTALRSDESAHTIIAALGAMAVLATLFGVATTVTQQQARLAERTRVQQNAIEVADGALEVLYAGWRKISSTSTADVTSALPSKYFDDEIPLPVAADFPSLRRFTASRTANTTYMLSNFKVEAVDPLLVPTADLNTPPPRSTGSGPGTYSYYYLASADVTLPTVQKTNRPLTAKVRRVFEKKVTSPWNWAVFFQDDLELHPSVPLTLNGWVHTNGSLFTGSSNLTLTDRLTYVGDWNVGWAPGDSAHTGTPTMPNSPLDLPPGPDKSWTPFGWYLSGVFNTTDSNQNNDGYRELIERPAAGADVMADKRYYEQADVRITVDANNNVSITDGKGKPVTAASTSTADKLLWATFQNGVGIHTNRSIQDNREAATVRLIDLDVAVIVAKYPALTSQFNGVIYISDTSADQNGGSPKRGVRLINGQSLPTGGLTVVSDNPVYVKGNFNTGGDAPPSNSGDATIPTAGSYTRQPAAIVGDAVTILSRDFADSSSGGNLSNRPAANTTVNAAILAGDVPTGSNGGNYSGGAENFVRFLEDWTDKTFTYYGSMVQLYHSKQGKGTWGKSNVYAPAVSKRYFDENLLTTSPPGKLVTVNYLQQQRWFLVY